VTLVKRFKMMLKHPPVSNRVESGSSGNHPVGAGRLL